MGITLDFIRHEIENQSYDISLHADDERIADGLTVSQVEAVLSNGEVLEEYPDDPRGESCLLAGRIPAGKAVHVICSKNRSGHLVLITVYVPSMPKWRDMYTRNRERS